MRMRKKKNADKRMLACEDYLLDVQDLDELRDGRRLYLEIGCGKGRFITETAKADPNTLYVGMERVFDVALLAVEKVREQELENVRITVGNAANVSELFPIGSVDRLYLNFSDPWPKDRHSKRRLTYRTFLEEYKKILSPKGEIFFKTDNRPLFDFSLAEFEECGFKLRNITNDLHKSQWEEGNIHTEYEDNFSAKGFTINRVEAYLE